MTGIDLDIDYVDSVWPYETGRLCRRLMSFDGNPEWRSLHFELSAALSRQADNKEIYCVTLYGGEKLHIQFYDGRVTLGLGSEPRRSANDRILNTNYPQQESGQ